MDYGVRTSYSISLRALHRSEGWLLDKDTSSFVTNCFVLQEESEASASLTVFFIVGARSGAIREQRQ